MVRGNRRSSAPATADPRAADSTALLPRGPPPRGTSARRGRGGGRAGAAADAQLVPVRRPDVAPWLTCGICSGLLRDATAISECLHAFCRQCIYDKLTKEDVKCCPACSVLLGPAPLEKLRSMIFHAKRHNVNAVTAKNEKRKEKVSTESTISSVVDINIGGRSTRAQKIEVEVINEADEASLAQQSVYEYSILNLAPVGRDTLSRIRCRDFYSACHLSRETGTLIVWQPPPIPEEMVAHYQLAPRQDPQTFGPPATSDTEYQQLAPAVQMTNTSVVGSSSIHAGMNNAQDDDNLRGDILAFFNESTTKIMGRYDAHISQLNAENSNLIEQLENERAAVLERTRMLEDRHQQELENERAAAAERTRMLEERHQQELENERSAGAERIRIIEERLQRESEIATSARNQIRSLEEQNARLYEALEIGRTKYQSLMSDNVEKSDELATLRYHCDMFESGKKDLENQVENLKKELEYTKREQARYVRQVLDAASRVPTHLAGEDPCTLLQ